MADENRFFRFVGRFNTLAIAVVIVGIAIVAIVLVAYSLISPWNNPYTVPVGHFAPVPKDAEKNYTYRIESEPLATTGTNERILVLRRWQGEPKEYGLADISKVSSYSRSDVQDVNFLVVDGDSAASHWLFPGYDRSILSKDAVYGARPATNTEQPLLAWVIQTVDADTNKDGELTPKDRKSLYVYRVGAGEAVKFLTTDNVLATQQIDADKYLVVYEKGKTATAATFSVPDFKLLSEKPLPNVPK